MLSPALKSKLETSVGVAVVAACGSVVGLLATPGAIPTTLDGWRPILATALATAVAAEVAYWRRELGLTTALTGTPGTIEQTLESTATTLVKKDLP